MAWRLAVATRNAAGDGLVDLLDAGTIQIRTGTQPDSADDTATGTLLAILTFASTAFSDFTAGVGSAEAIASGIALVTGTAGHARFLNSDGLTHSDLDIGEGSGTVNFDDVDFLDGGTVAISSVAFSMPSE